MDNAEITVNTIQHWFNMASPAVRKKRNFKALALQVDAPAPVADVVAARPLAKVGVAGSQMTAVAATRAAPSAPNKRKPPAMDLSKSKVPAEAVDVPQHSPSPLAVSTPKSASLSASSPSRSSYHSLQERLATMEIGHSDASLDLKADDFRTLSELGQGNGGTVSKVEHVPTQKIMAKKVSITII